MLGCYFIEVMDLDEVRRAMLHCISTVLCNFKLDSFFVLSGLSDLSSLLPSVDGFGGVAMI